MVENVSQWQCLVRPENLWQAYLKAKKGKSRRPDVASFSLNVDRELIDLRDELVGGRYRPRGYRRFLVHDRKPRQISAAPFRDRVVHHALIQVTEASFENQFSDHSWACRCGRGTHRAVQQCQRWTRRYAYALKMDIQGYFHNIDRVRLMSKIEDLIFEPEILDLFQLIIDSQPSSNGKGLPIGNLTSQVLGNLYLNDIDHFVTGNLGYKAYLRYVDDMLILSDDKHGLWRSLADVEDKLADEGLNLHLRKVYLQPTRCGLDFLGYRVYPRMVKLRAQNGYHFRRRLKHRVKAYHAGKMEWKDLNAGVQSWLGHARHADSLGLRKALFSDIVLHPGVSEQAVDSRRFVEQQTGQPAFRQPEQEQGG